MRKKVIGALLIVVFISMSLPLISMSTATTGNAQLAQVASIYALGSSTGSSTISADRLRYYNTTPSSGFYAGLGTIYTVKTLDGLNIKVLRYHPAGQSFNFGKQPILLFPGIMANINEFLSHSTPRLKQLYPNVTLPDNLADWAVNDTNIQNDPLLYNSPAYYLWAQGYDVWLANYRGVGYQEMKSDKGSLTTSLDTFALYDARAALNLVYSVTKQHPVVGGHSTGGLVTMMLLQGTQFKNGHVVANDTLAQERNGKIIGPETIKGFIALEPAGIPSMASWLNTPLTWALLDTNLYLDIRSIIQLLDGTGQLSLVALTINLLNQLGPTIGSMLGPFLYTDLTDFSPAIMYYQEAYALDNMYYCTLAQYSDFAFNNVIREFFRNGAGNKYLFSPPSPHAGDGYYYYTGNNMKKMSVPIIAILATYQSAYLDLVNATEIIKDFVNGKTPAIPSTNDQYWYVQGNHIDTPIGLRAPTDAFPHIGSWLAVVAPP